MVPDQKDTHEPKVTVREIRPGLYHVHENPHVATRARERFDRVLESGSNGDQPIKESKTKPPTD